MAKKTTDLAILFADISGSTRLFEILGDAVARVKIAECLEVLTAVTKDHSGTVIKTIGDEIMCTFETADVATEAAIAMHEAVDEDRGEIQTQIKIRIGMHFGSAIMEGGDVFGDAVNVAARMTAQAKGGQIIIPQSTVDKLSPLLRASSRFVDRAPIKGKKEEIDIYEIIWQEDDVTTMAADILTEKPKEEVRLRIRYHDREIELNKARNRLIMGRSQSCDLPVNEKLASRQHVIIELRKDKFFIVDQSTNGTHILFDGAQGAFLRREEIPIDGNGRISLGRAFNEAPTEVVVFTQVSCKDGQG